MAAVLIRRLPLPSSVDCVCPLFRVPSPSSPPLCFSVAARHPHQATCYRFNYVSGLSIDKRTRAARSLADFHSNDRLECYFSQFLFSPVFCFLPSLFRRFLFCPFIFNRSSTSLFVLLFVSLSRALSLSLSLFLSVFLVFCIWTQPSTVSLHSPGDLSLSLLSLFPASTVRMQIGARKSRRVRPR